MLIILHVQQRMLQSTVKMTAYQLMLHAFKTAVEVKEWLNFYFPSCSKLSPIYTRCRLLLKFELSKECMRQCSRDFGVCSDNCPCYTNCYNGCPCTYERKGPYLGYM